jgi:hypothetical protein
MGSGAEYGWVARVFVALVGGGFWAYCLADFARTNERRCASTAGRRGC